MEEKITKELKRIEKQTAQLEKKHAKARTEEEETILLVKLYKLDGEFAAYMNVLKMIKEGVQI
jgi:hypothetical protein